MVLACSISEHMLGSSSMAMVRVGNCVCPVALAWYRVFIFCMACSSIFCMVVKFLPAPCTWQLVGQSFGVACGSSTWISPVVWLRMYFMACVLPLPVVPIISL